MLEMTSGIELKKTNLTSEIKTSLNPDFFLPKP